MLMITVIVTVLCCILTGAAVLAAVALIRKLMRKAPLSSASCVKLFVCVSAVPAVFTLLFFTFVYYRAVPPAWSYIESGENVNVSREGRAYFFDGPGDDKALIFYPGALVETEAYSQIMYTLAENGIDTFLVDMPFHVALNGIYSADDIISSHTYDEWYMSGHSLGGFAASEYCTQTKNRIDGIVLLAAYSSGELDSGISVCLIHGSEDKVLSHEEFEKSRQLYNGRVEELYIEGGNHAQFGSYGEQLGDGTAAVSSDEQKRMTAEKIISFINGQ